MTLSNLLLSGDPDQVESARTMQLACDNLASVKDMIDSSTVFSPFKICGFVAQANLTVSLVSTAFTVYAAIFSTYLQANGAKGFAQTVSSY